MFQNLIKLWKWFSFIGTEESVPLEINKRIVISNRLALAIFMLMLLLLIVFLKSGRFPWYITAIVFIPTIQSLLTPVLNKNGFHYIATISICVTLPFAVVLFFILQKIYSLPEQITESDFYRGHLWLIASIVFPFLTIDPRKKILLITLSATPVVLMLILEPIVSLYGVGFADLGFNPVHVKLFNVSSVIVGILLMACLFMMNNITRFFQQKLFKTQKQLMESDKHASLGVLASGMGHEINNPLNFIKGGIEGLSSHLEKQNFPIDHDTDRFVGIIKEGVYRVANIVGSLSHFSRETKHMDEECDVNNILDNCLVILENKLKHRVRIVRAYTVEKSVIPGNEGRLHQAFLNVISNAEQAIEGQGSITLTTINDANQIKITISDSGVGIPEKILDRIMDPFFTTKDPGVGTGLGLSITYKIIEEHGGQINVNSEPGKGSEFRIILPL